jgi:hypothetical protein
MATNNRPSFMSVETDADIAHVLSLMCPDVEPLTDALYQELLQKGFDKKMLDEVKQLGWGFNRSRMSFVSPPVFEFD